MVIVCRDQEARRQDPAIREDPAIQEEHNARQRARLQDLAIRQRARRQDPAIREEHNAPRRQQEAHNARQRAQQEAHNARQRARLQDPATRVEHNAQQRERMQDPAIREQHNAQRRARRQAHLQESRESRATPNWPPTPKKAGSRRRENSRMTSSRYRQKNHEMINLNARKRSWQKRWSLTVAWTAAAACQSAAQRLLRHVLAKARVRGGLATCQLPYFRGAGREPSDENFWAT